jgi:hypothetical protein
MSGSIYTKFDYRPTPVILEFGKRELWFSSERYRTKWLWWIRRILLDYGPMTYERVYQLAKKEIK